MTSKVLNSKLGDKNFRYGVKNPNEVIESQSNIKYVCSKVFG